MAKSKMKTGGVILVVFVSALIIAGLYLGISYAVKNTALGGDGSDGDSGCNIAPSVNLLESNTLVPGTAPSSTANYSIYKGTYVGTIPSSLSKGASLDVLATASSYLNARNSISSLKCDSNDLPLEFTPYQIATYTVSDDSYNTLTDGATAVTLVNVSSSANTVKASVKISGQPDKSTGDMLFFVDYTNKTEVTTAGITMSGDAKKVDCPSWVSPAGTTSALACFEIPAIVDGGDETYTLYFAPESGETIGGQGTGVYTTIYALQPVILDTNTGTFLTEKTWSDSLGADSTIANTDYDFFIDP